MKRKGLCALIALVLGSAGAVSVAHAQDSMTQDTTTTQQSTPTTTTTDTTTQSAPVTTTDTMQTSPDTMTTQQTTTQDTTTTTTMTTTDTGYGSWYIVPRIGGAFGDKDRHVKADLFGGLGVGFWVTPNLTLDLEAGTDNADYKKSTIRADKQWESDQIDVAARWYFMDPASPWRPYIMAGVGAVRHAAVSGKQGEEGGPWSDPVTGQNLNGTTTAGVLVGINGVPYGTTQGGVNYGLNPSSNKGYGWGPMATVGVGVLYNINDRIALRGELAARYYRDTTSMQLTGFNVTENSPPRNRGDSSFVDGLATIGLVIKMGHAAPPPPAVAPPATDCSTMDSDHDGVNDCNDKCPDTPAGTIVGPDGCPQNVVIDLRGVNFKFDRPKKGETNIGPTLKAPESESLAILDQAVDTLKRYPQVQIEIDGHTDSVGTEQYNMGLSDRRANIVDGYMTSHGIDASRITAVKGFGEDHPIDTNSTAAGRQRNRRVELVVQGQNAAQGDQMPPPPPAEMPMEEHHAVRHHHRARHHHKAAANNGATTTTTTTTTEPASAPASSSTSGQ